MQIVKRDVNLGAEMDLDTKTINRCVHCGSCRSVCPVFEESGWESSNTRGRILVIKGLSDGLDDNKGVLDSLNTCTTCGICTENCPAGINPPMLIEKTRKELVRIGVMTQEQAALNQNIHPYGNILGEPGNRYAWLQNHRAPKKKADIVYFVGCMNSYRYPGNSAATFAVLSRFGATLLPDEQCCGSPLIRTGFDAQTLIDKNIEQIKNIGARTIITGCAGCYSTLKQEYLSLIDYIQVTSIPEFLAEHITNLGLRPLDITVTYHDPCHLGRGNKIYDPPRQIIKSICEMKEMRNNRERARCCGAGGGVRAGYKDLSLKMAKKRLNDVPEGVDYIITSCPMCLRNLKDAGAGEKAIDLMQLVTMAIDNNQIQKSKSRS